MLSLGGVSVVLGGGDAGRCSAVAVRLGLCLDVVLFLSLNLSLNLMLDVVQALIRFPRRNNLGYVALDFCP